jgi:hypothetical protein
MKILIGISFFLAFILVILLLCWIAGIIEDKHSKPE